MLRDRGFEWAVEVVLGIVVAFGTFAGDMRGLRGAGRIRVLNITLLLNKDVVVLTLI